MPPLPIIADTYRVTMDFVPFGGLTIRNVFHVSSALNNEAGIAAAIDNDFENACIHCTTDDFEIGSWSVLPLDGTTATLVYPSTNAYKGSGTGDYSPATSGIVKLSTAQRGPRGRGRQFIGPVAEDFMSDGSLDFTVAGTMTTGWQAFQAALHAESPSIVLGVASYVHADVHAVTAINTEIILGTQRRRQNQLR